ncbi:hypothetical protein FOA52_012576 [Chlamydomonas sp. UWO 241]|nr:hypothetical protein FOA52_012576 [Chlamydomonas sp. UWO 241]
MDPHVLFQLSMAHFELWLLSRQVQAATSSHAVAAPEVRSACMIMLRSAATKAAQLSEDGHDMSEFEASCAWAERTPHAAAAKRALTVAHSFNLATSSGPGVSSQFRLPTGRLPAAATLSGQSDFLEAARQRAQEKLGTVQLLSEGNKASFNEMWHAMNVCKSGDSVSAQIVLRNVFKQLSRSSFLAQQMLLPPTGHADLSKLTVSFVSKMDAHYNEHRPSKYHASIERSSKIDDVKLVSRQSAPKPAEIGASHIDGLIDVDDGVWHPDELTIEMGWMGSKYGEADELDGIKKDGYFDPFVAVSAATTEPLFTEELAPPGLSASPLQWVMHVRNSVSSTPADRGNMTIARQDLRPAWLSKPGFLALGSLRAYPSGQLRRLTELLQLRELPWAQLEVVTVIRQTLYQLGTLVEHEGAVRQLWRSDWTDSGGTLAALSSELEQLADELAQTPRSHDDVLLRVEVAAFLSEWHAPCVRTARIFAAMTRRAADELDNSIAEAAGSAAQSQLLARQCKLRMLSLLCYGPGALADADDAAAVLQLMVQVKHGHVFFVDIPKAEDAQLRALHRGAHPPPSLIWSRLGKSGSFEAEGGGHLFSINVLDGAVLMDGYPPGRLHMGILDHLLHKRTFGDHDFEVARASDGVLKTTKAVAGRLYNFLMDGDRLFITEIDIQQATFRPTRPPPITEKHQIIALRPPNFRMHGTHFIASIAAEQQRNSSSGCGGATNATSSVSSASSSGSSVSKLQVSCTWDVATHPEWLVFEAEGQLQIRPVQHYVTGYLLSNPSAVVQLNMGEGKTRVILPMLVMALANGRRHAGRGDKANLVRLNFPSTLLHDLHKHIHRYLTASVLGRKVLLMPFNRDVQITESGARSMLAALHHC